MGYCQSDSEDVFLGSVCLFAAFLAHQGLRALSISSYLSALRHLQVLCDVPSPQWAEWLHQLSTETVADYSNNSERLAGGMYKYVG